MKDMTLLNETMMIVKSAARFTESDGFQIFSKGTAEDIVTSADIDIQRFLEKELCALLPGSGFFGEESEPGNADNKLCWIVDPIDGTQNFARNLGQSGISIALRDGDEVALGVVYNPFLEELYWAEKGKGAFLNGRPIHVASDRTFKEGILCTALSLYNKEHATVCHEIIIDAYMKCNDIRRFGACSLELCYLAAGRVDLYFEYRLSPWDYAAASLILTEAGGAIGSFPEDKVSLTLPCTVIAANNKENYKTLKDIARAHILTK